jgi:hypothetical protein
MESGRGVRDPGQVPDQGEGRNTSINGLSREQAAEFLVHQRDGLVRMIRRRLRHKLIAASHAEDLVSSAHRRVDAMFARGTVRAANHEELLRLVRGVLRNVLREAERRTRSLPTFESGDEAVSNVAGRSSGVPLSPERDELLHRVLRSLREKDHDVIRDLDRGCPGLDEAAAARRQRWSRLRRLLRLRFGDI